MPLSPRPAAGPPGAAPGTFRWSDVAAADRDWLQRRTEDVVTYAYNSVSNLVRAGLVLIEVRDKLPWGLYGAWVDAQTPFSRPHAHRLVSVAEAFGDYLSQIETIDRCALYLLAQAGTPPAARALAVRAAGAGERVTRADALEMLGAVRGEEPTAREVRAHARATAKLTVEGPGAEPGESAAAANWAVLEELVAASTLVHVSKLDDGDDDELYSVTCHREHELPRVAVRRSLADAIAAAAGKEPLKACPGCVEDYPDGKLVGEFGFDSTNADGRNRYCKVCERARRSAGRKRKKKGRGAGPAA